MSAGTHTFNVSDANSCSKSVTVTITQPSQLSAVSSCGTVSCNGGSATITVGATGGTAPYTGTGIFSAGAGLHTYTIGDANGCSATTSVNISQPSSIIASATSGSILCHGGTTTVNVTATGGNAPYTGLGIFTVSAGTHTFNVSDANGCYTTVTRTITQPSVLNASIVSGAISGFSGTTTLTVSASGGTSPYLGTGTFTVTAGTYTYVVTDANGCSKTLTVTLSQPSQLVVSTTQGSILCYGGTTTVNVTASGGIAPYTGVGTFTAGAGTQTYLVTDANNNTAIATITLGQPSQLTATTFSGNILCYGGLTSVTVAASGGTLPYSGIGIYSRTTGVHSFTVSDVNGCSVVSTITLTQPSVLTASAQTGTIMGYGGTTTVNINANGGTPPYFGTGTYTVSAGTHTYNVTDGNGCSKTLTVVVYQPTQLIVSATHGSILCNGGTTTVNIAASGGVLPYSGTGTFTVNSGTYTYQVTDANNTTVTATLNISQPSQVIANVANNNILCFGGLTTVSVSANAGTPPYSGTGSYSRSAGVHSFVVSDANGCAAFVTTTISQPAQLIMTTNAGNILCHGASATLAINASGGTSPYSGTGTYTSLAGTHSYSITDANGCSAITTVTLIQPSQLSASALSGTISGFGGSTTVNVSATGGTSPYSGIGTFTAGSGVHTYTVTDANGCWVILTVTLAEPGQLLVSANHGSIQCFGGATTVTVNASGGIAPYSGIGTFTANAGTHTFVVTDANNNIATAIVNITQPTQLVAASLSGSILCNGGTTGVIVSATGGSAPYSGIGTFSIVSGIHVYTVSDANGCSANSTVTITQPTQLATSVLSSSILCNGGTSNVTVSATGGTLPYSGSGIFNRSTGTHSFLVIDANGCFSNATVTLVQPSLLTASVLTGSIQGFGGTTTVTITANGGTSPYLGTGTYTAGAGTHTYIVTDANGCSKTLTVSLSQPGQLVVSVTQGSILCYGGTTTLTITASGGVAPYAGVGIFTVSAGTYTYLVTDVNNNFVTTTISIGQPSQINVSSGSSTILCHGGISSTTISANGGTSPYLGTGTYTAGAGTHTYLVTDANGCSSTTTMALLQPPQLTAFSQSGNILCHGGSTTYTVNATGGIPPYVGIGTYTANAGNYSNLITDANGCSSVSTLTITQPSQMLPTVLTGSISGFGGTTTVNITASGGTSPYVGTGTFTVGAGTHTFIVADANSCSKTLTVTLSQPGQLLVSTLQGNVSCYGGTTTLNITASGGVAPYTGVGTYTATAGTHTYLVTDANNTTATATVTIGQPSQLLASSVAGNILCNGGTTTVTVSATGGTAAYTGTGTFTTNAGANTYTVSDANGCVALTSLTITQPLPLTASSAEGNILCYGGTTTVTISANGGLAPYTNAGTHTVAVGSYSFLVIDANGCSITVSDSIAQPSELLAFSAAGNILCYGGTTTISLTASGGTLPYSGTGSYITNSGIHTYSVADANGCSAATTVTITQPSEITAVSTSGSILCYGGATSVSVTASGGVVPYSGVGTYTSLAGTQTYLISDANGCSGTTSITIVQPTQLVASSSNGNVLCAGGAATLTINASGGTPVYGGTGNVVRNAGVHSFTVTDANACSAVTTVTLTEPTLLTASINAGAINCSGGMTSVTLSANGGQSPYNGIGTFTANAGLHTYTVTDANGCFASASVTISQPPQVIASVSNGTILCNGGTATVLVSATGGIAPYSGVGNYTASPGLTTFSVTDSNGCSSVATATITQPSQIIVSAISGNVLCFGGIATVSIAASGGTLPYTGVGTYTAMAGIHSYTVLDLNGCMATTTLLVTEPTQLVAAVSPGTVLCNGGSTTLTVSATGGNGPYSGIGVYSVSSGSYTFVVNDATGCASSTSLTVNEPSPVVLNLVADSILCHGASSSVSISATGGNAPYSGIGAYTVTAGVHTFSVTDVSGCSSSTLLAISQPDPVVIDFIADSILCNGGTTTVSISALGGITPYSGVGTFTVSSGIQTYSVTDANGCSASTVVAVTEPAQVTVGFERDSILCSGGIANATISAQGGTPLYSGTGIVAVSAGTQTYVVTDALGCSASTVVTVTEPAVLLVSFVADSILCNGGLASATVSASGGIAPYVGTGVFVFNPGVNSVMVNDANGCSAMASRNITEPSPLQATFIMDSVRCFGGFASIHVSALGGTMPYSGIGTFTALVGTHSFAVIDTNGCSSSTIITVTQPPQLIAGAIVNSNILCYGDSASVTVFALGGTGYYFNYVTDSMPCMNDTLRAMLAANGGTVPYWGPDTYMVPPGSYTYGVVDSHCCWDTAEIVIASPPQLVVSSIMGPVPCFGAQTTLTVQANGGTVPYSGTGIYNVSAGSYIYQVFDANGCSDTMKVIIDTSACTSIDDYGVFEKGKLRIYPNPNNGSFRVSGIEEGKAQLLNQAGQLVKELVFKNNEEVLVEELAEGMYFFVSSRVRVKIVVLH